jgi:Domain of unknown function (DUF1877)
MSILASFRELLPEEEAKLRADPDFLLELIGRPNAGVRALLDASKTKPWPEAAKEHPEAARALLRGMLRQMGRSRSALQALVQKGQGLEALLKAAAQLAPDLDAQKLIDLAYPPGEPETLQLGKAWHGVHWLVTGRVDGGDPPLSDLISGGEKIGPDLGYGPATILPADTVAQVSKALDAIPADGLRAKFDLDKALAESIYSVQSAGDAEWLIESYAELAAFYDFAARNGRAVLRWFS